MNDLEETLDVGMSDSGSGLNSSSKGFLRETAKWAYFLSIMGFIGLGLMTIISFIIMSMGSQLRGFGGGQAIGMGIGYLVMVALYFFPTLYLNKFATLMRRGLESNNESLITNGFENLKSLFKFTGILTIVIMSFYLLVFLFGGLASILR